MLEAQKSLVFKLMKKCNLPQAKGYSDDLILVNTFSMHGFYRMLGDLHFNAV